MTEQALPYVEVITQSPHDATVIWLHGLGDSGNGFAPIVNQFQFPSTPNIRFIFPHAPVQPVTINNGMPMRAWYDIKSLNFEDRADKQGVEASAAKISAMIQQEINNGIPAQRIILAGFSQGGVIALHLANTLDVKIGGVLAMSTYLSHSAVSADRAINGSTPIQMMHGTGDDVVPFALGQHSFQQMEGAGFNIHWKDYPMQHNVCPEQINDIATWLYQTLEQ